MKNNQSSTHSNRSKFKFNMSSPTDIRIDNRSYDYIKHANDKSKFYYTKKETYESEIIIYTNIQFEKDIKYNNDFIPEEIILPKNLIAVPAKAGMQF